MQTPGNKVIKHDDCFAVFDTFGDIVPYGIDAQGIFYRDTRFLSRMEMVVNQLPPLLLSSNVQNNNYTLGFDLTNPKLLNLEQGTIHINRKKILWENSFHEEITFTNYGDKPIELTVDFILEADFIDIFELRGSVREKRGDILPVEVLAHGVNFYYQGTDGIKRGTKVAFKPRPQNTSDNKMSYEFSLSPHGPHSIEISFGLEVGESLGPLPSFYDIRQRNIQYFEKLDLYFCSIHSSNEHFNEWIYRSKSDLQMLMTHTEHGPYPYAGIPWYNTIFGRDGLWTAIQTVWVAPELSKGVLNNLAKMQATEIDEYRQSAPGKIVHELRQGEMSLSHEIPFEKYYGTIDATPLFVVLAGYYFRATNDEEFIRSIWRNILSALSWIDIYGDIDGDGFVEYKTDDVKGLINQGWKDSFDSISNQNGELVKGNIALCEVQSYVYDAKIQAAMLARVLGDFTLAHKLEVEAKNLKTKFNEAFWSDRLGSYVIALDSNKGPCEIMSSNCGHCLFGKIVDDDRVESVVKSLFQSDMNSGWGIRTLSEDSVRYNPMSYHNGSIWPHDNAIIAMGLANYNYNTEIGLLVDSFFQVANYMDLNRLPELFCGFTKTEFEGPTLYPVACIPQAWASAAVFTFIASALGLRMDAPDNTLYFYRPFLPPSLEEVWIRNLKVGDSMVDLMLSSYEGDVGINVLKKTGDLKIQVIK